MLAPIMDLFARGGGEVVSQAQLGDVVVVTGPERDGWVEVESGGERGDCLSQLLGAWPDSERACWVASPEALAYHEPTRRAGPPSWRLPLGARLPAKAADHERNGFVSVTVRGLETWVQAEDLAASPPRASSPEARLAVAASLLGRPYVWGGATSLGLDCSGLCRLLAGLAGLVIPHSAAGQAELATDRFVVAHDPRPGDFVYLAPPGGRVDHVVVWAGRDQVLHASAEAGVPCVRRERWAAVAPRGEVVAVRRIREPAEV